MEDVNISVFKDLLRPNDAPFIMPISKVLERIRVGKSKNLIDEIRKGNKELKKKLPSILFAGEFQERNGKGLKVHSGLMVLDCDKYPDTDTMLDQFNLIKKNKHVVSIFVSPSGNGLKVIIKVPKTLNKETHPQYFKAFQDKFKFKYFDISNSNVDRVCFESYDPNIYINNDAVTFKTFEMVPDIEATENETIEWIMTWDWKRGFTEGSRNEYVFNLASAYCEYGVSEMNAIGYINANIIDGDFSEREANTAIKSAYKIREFGINKFTNNYASFNTPKPPTKIDKNNKTDKYLEIFNESLLTPNDSFDKPPSIFTIGEVDYGTLGNISMIIGKAKSKKSMLIALFTAIVLKENKSVLYFDTEQSNYHAWLQTKRLLTLSNDCSKLSYSALRKHNPTTRLKVIEKAIYSMDNISLVVIDGIADLLTKGVNDEQEAISVVGELMKWSQERNIHIITILHQNKADGNAKGHLGSQLGQKSETVISVDKNENDKNISKVESIFSRGIGIESFHIAVDEYGVPYVTDHTEMKNKSKKPFDYELKVTEGIIRDVFKNESELKYADLFDKLKYTLSQHGINIGKNVGQEWIIYFKEQGMITQPRERKPYKLNVKNIAACITSPPL